ncbi:MAG TPA: hypothetical protein VHO06_24330 [Polyangia bacterium]|nr:hypothetical protein [Polyangia bacterium]
MLPPRERTRRSQAGVGLVLLASALMIVVVSTPWSARAADDDESPKASVPEAPQAEDNDRPHDKSLLEKQPADAAVAKQNQAGDEAFYQKWQFWAVTGGIIAGGLLLFFGGKALYHSLNGGDVRPCNTMAFINCYGQGEPNP